MTPFCLSASRSDGAYKRLASGGNATSPGIASRGDLSCASDSATGATNYGNVYTQLLEYIVSADLVFYVLLVVAVIVLRKKRPDADRPYRTWGYPAVPIVSVLLAAFLIVDLAYLAPTTSGIGYLLVLTGIPVYFIWRRGFAADRSS